VRGTESKRSADLRTTEPGLARPELEEQMSAPEFCSPACVDEPAAREPARAIQGCGGAASACLPRGAELPWRPGLDSEPALIRLEAG